jgi:hypothetical protein
MRTLIGILAWLWLAGLASGQAITTSSLTGTVLDDEGTRLSGVTVTVLHVPTAGSYTTVSRSDGRFSLRGLFPGGPYVVSAAAEGYGSVRLDNVFLDLDRGADVNLRFTGSEVVELDAFEVTATDLDRLFNPDQTGSGSYFGSSDISNLPVGDRSINSLARLDPRISFNRDPQDRAISVSGLSNRFNSIQIDGVNASDPFGLNANNTAAERNVIPLDSLDAITVESSPYNARNAGFVGARINAVTKRGTNDFRGSLSYSYRANDVGGLDLVGEELDGVTRSLPNFEEKTLSATLGGPILRDRLFFFVAYERVREDRIPPSPNALIDPAIRDQIVAAARSLGFDPGSTEIGGNELTDDNILVKLDWLINQDHRATFRYNNVESSRPTFPGFGTGNARNNFSFDSHWYDQQIRNRSYIAQVISRWSDRLDTEVSVSRSEYYSEPINKDRQPMVQIRGVPVPGDSATSFVRFGTERSRHANLLEVDTNTAEFFATYELNEKHTLQAGLQYDLADIYNLFVQDALGNYDFNNLAQFLAVAANNNGTVNYRTYTYNQIIDGVNPAAEFKEANLGFFVNDQWQVKPNLVVNLGFRVDLPQLPDAIPYNAMFAEAFGVRNDYSYDGEKVFQPRIGFNWQPEVDKTTIIRGGFGLFYGRAPRVWISNSYSNTGMNFRTWSAGTNPVSGVSSSQAPVVSGNPDAQALAGGAPAQQVAFLDPDFVLPSRWKGNLAIERELGFWDLKGTLEYERTEVKKDIFYENINLAKTGTGPDGRDLYFNAYGATAGGTRLVDPRFTNRIIKLGNTDKGGTESFTLGIERPMKADGWTWRVAYVHTSAEEVLFGTSSVAASNWQNRSIFNTNEPELKRSELEIRDRVTANLTKQFELVKGFQTTVTVFYEGRSGYPFSFVSGADMNGDGLTTNDLIYIPTRGGDPRARFASPLEEERFYQIVDRFNLTEGEAVAGASENYPWVNQFDISIKQDIKLPGWRHKVTLGLDILNFGNLLNDKWGLIRGSNQFFRKSERIANVTYDGVNEQYVYANVNQNLANGDPFAPSLGRGEPAATRWSALLSARYSF